MNFNPSTRQVSRRPNTDRQGSAFPLFTIESVWQKGKPIYGRDPTLYRTDICGKLIARQAYGRTDLSEGWEIDHIKPVAKGGGDELANLQPLQWTTNRAKSDKYPWHCS
ncbi:HNH endonuclease signature motif containing protein [Catalinimonas alkaloidigena]|uniref:HNH endonuclease signature motif containing protein n=1 Tax=Catalinimonas alkaloidigena TaxID=1075417 RepID=UPI000B7DC8E9|nr:HNH endonuclease signature motif containing protein [Catalinimonas alkaloidigena]